MDALVGVIDVTVGASPCVVEATVGRPESDHSHQEGRDGRPPSQE
jgi:hypothetical protein